VNDQIVRLTNRYGVPQRVEVTLPSGTFDPLNSGLSSGRTREVAFAVLRPNGRVLLQTKSIYPEGTFRIPTGGVEEDEDIEEALKREVREEMGLDVEIRRFFALIEYSAPELTKAFTTYAFLLRETGGTLLASEPHEKISGWREVVPSDLVEIARQLEGMDGGWRAWGLFRAPVHRVLAELLMKIVPGSGFRVPS
jgi:ADP-ribose pyrophosphatase YjhB (NUDIX family)